MGLRSRLAATAAEATRAGLERAKAPLAGDDQTALGRLRRLATSDEQLTVERLLLLFVDAIREDEVRSLTTRDVKKAGKKRTRRAALVGFAGGPFGMYLAGLYAEAEILSDVVDRHGLQLTDEELAAHLLVLWRVIPNLPAAHAAMTGTGPTVAAAVAANAGDRLALRWSGKRPAKELLKLLWQVRQAVVDNEVPRAIRPTDLVLPAVRVKAVVEASERQLGVSDGSRGLFRRRPAGAARQIPRLDPHFYAGISQSLAERGGAGSVPEVAAAVANAVENVTRQLLAPDAAALARFEESFSQRAVADTGAADRMIDWLVRYDASFEQTLQTLLGRLSQVLAQPA